MAPGTWPDVAAAGVDGGGGLPAKGIGKKGLAKTRFVITLALSVPIVLTLV